MTCVISSKWACGSGATPCAAAMTAAATGSSVYVAVAGDTYASNPTAGYAAHAGVGCASSVASGGNCSQGAAAAVFGKFATVSIGGTPGQFNGYQFAATMVAGGVGSVIAGGKFENGAKTAAFGYLFKAAPKAYESLVGYELDLSPGGDAVQKGYEQPPVKGANNIGTQGELLNPDCLFCEGGIVSRAANQIPGINAIAGMHDVMQINTPGIWRDIFNVPAMAVAGAFTYGAALGQVLNAIPSPTYIYSPQKVGGRRDSGYRAPMIIW